MSHPPQVPPWEPIAEWLLRIDDSVPEHKQELTEESTEYEIKAKAIAYDIAVQGSVDQ